MYGSTFFSIGCALVMVLMSATTCAALIDRGGGLIYDSDQDLTWTQDAGMSGWVDQHQATDWAANLEFGGLDDWRLPTTMQFDDSTCSGDARNDGKFNLFFEHRLGCTGGEMELLTYLHDPWTNPIFENVGNTRYWTATPYRDEIDPCINYPDYDVACNINDGNDNGDRSGFYWQWAFQGFDGYQGPAYKTAVRWTTDRYAWAVRDGDVLSAVPVPATIYLFGSGLLGLFGVMKRKAG